MKLTSVLCLLFLMVLSVSCGKSEQKTSEQYSAIPILPEDVSFIMEHQLMDCDSLGGSCPQGVARLIVLNPEDLKKTMFCSGFMVGPTTLVTNQHCVKNQNVCEMMKVVVYTGPGRYHLSRCKKIIKSFQDFAQARDPRRKQDFAILEIEDSYSGRYFPIATERAKVGDVLTTWVIDHTGLNKEEYSNFFESRVTQFDCHVANLPRYGSLQIKNCPIISGNSGSPLLNSKGEVVGVIWGTDKSKLTTQTPMNVRRASKITGLATEMIYFKDYL